MARKKSEKIRNAASPQPEQLTMRITVGPGDELASHYVNYAEATAGPHECCISFVRVPSKLSEAQTEEVKVGGVLRLEPVVQVIIPPTLLPGLIRALSITKDSYEKIVGVIHEPKAPK